MSYSIKVFNQLKNILGFFVLATFIVTASGKEANAQIAVVDATNLAQNLLTAMRTLQSNVNEAQMISNELRNLQSLSGTSTTAYSSQYMNFLSELQNVQGSLGNAINAQKSFNSLYPNMANTPTYSGSNMLTSMNGWQTNLSNSLSSSVGTGSSVMQSIPVDQANVNALVSASNNSQGILQATQAGNQLTATVSQQLGQMNGQLATYNAAVAAKMAQDQSQQAAAVAANNHIYGDYTNLATSQPVTLPSLR